MQRSRDKARGVSEREPICLGIVFPHFHGLALGSTILVNGYCFQVRLTGKHLPHVSGLHCPCPNFPLSQVICWEWTSGSLGSVKLLLSGRADQMTLLTMSGLSFIPVLILISIWLPW